MNWTLMIVSLFVVIGAITSAVTMIFLYDHTNKFKVGITEMKDVVNFHTTALATALENHALQENAKYQGEMEHLFNRLETTTKDISKIVPGRSGIPIHIQRNLNMGKLTQLNPVKDFNMIDAIVIINLPRSSDRLERLRKEVTERFPNTPLHVLRGVEESQKDLGIMKSHISALNHFVDKNANVLILEDDFEFTPEFNNDTLEDFYKENPDFNVFFLSPYVLKWERTDTQFMRVTKGTTASGYIVNKDVMGELEDFWSRRLEHIVESDEYIPGRDAIDQSWHILQENGKWFTTKKAMGQQKPELDTFHEKMVDNRFLPSEDLKTFNGMDILQEDVFIH
jgi:hypothetical protein